VRSIDDEREQGVFPFFLRSWSSTRSRFDAFARRCLPCFFVFPTGPMCARWRLSLSFFVPVCLLDDSLADASRRKSFLFVSRSGRNCRSFCFSKILFCYGFGQGIPGGARLPLSDVGTCGFALPFRTSPSYHLTVRRPYAQGIRRRSRTFRFRDVASFFSLSFFSFHWCPLHGRSATLSSFGRTEVLTSFFPRDRAGVVR